LHVIASGLCEAIPCINGRVPDPAAYRSRCALRARAWPAAPVLADLDQLLGLRQIEVHLAWFASDNVPAELTEVTRVNGQTTADVDCSAYLAKRTPSSSASVCRSCWLLNAMPFSRA
jgi:hypothetical protein